MTGWESWGHQRILLRCFPAHLIQCSQNPTKIVLLINSAINLGGNDFIFFIKLPNAFIKNSGYIAKCYKNGGRGISANSTTSNIQD